MKATLLAVVAMFFYALFQTIVDRHLRQISPVVNVAFPYVGVMLVALPMVLLREPLRLDLVMPQSSSQWRFIILCGMLLFFADLCLYSAYHSGGSLISVTTCSLLVPVLASLIKYAGGGGVPTTRQFLGWALTAIGVILVSEPLMPSEVPKIP